MAVLGMISRIAKDTKWVFHILFSMLMRKVLRSEIRCGFVRFVERMSPYALHFDWGLLWCSVALPKKTGCHPFLNNS